MPAQFPEAKSHKIRPALFPDRRCADGNAVPRSIGTAKGLEAASICFPFRRLFHKKKDFHFRLTKVLSVDYDEKTHSVIMDDGSTIKARILIWVSGVIAVTMDGVPETSIGKGGRIICNQYMEVEGMDSVFAAGDIAVTTEDAYPNGHPQMAQVAMQQAKLIAKNLNAVAKGKERKTFKYVNLGSMATIGRNKAVADIGGMHFSGFIAWGMWMVIHLRSILGVKNKIIVLFDWIINYFNYIGSLRLLMFKGKR